ncbi:peptidase family m20/M25/M40 domain-containing protein [Ditylenchus destructor]|nr:peptidase family m20/M25/M40 domain-containing protein [Ditylenchus destructor]
MSSSEAEHPAVTKFREYLRLNTEQPNPNYRECEKYLYAYGKELGFDVWSYECVEGKPIVGMTLLGTDPSLKSLSLCSHTDVVPTFREHWTHDPYSAYKDSDGNIFARGAQDMKCVGVQYMEALRSLLEGKPKDVSGKIKPVFPRTIHILWNPDEEIGSHDGAERFVHTDRFKQLNVGFGLDEGLASEDDAYKVYYGERCVWWMKVICPGSPGHGSRFIENTAGPKLRSIIDSFSDFREKQEKLLKSNPKLKLGDVTSVNLTKVEGGVQVNVIPSAYVAWFDLRITPTDDLEKMEAQIVEWCKKAGDDVTYEFIQKGTNKNLTPTTKDDPWWSALSSVFEQENCKISKEIFIGGTDARFLRWLGYRAIGFSPMINTPCLLHDHNEFLNERVFLRGVDIYKKIIPRLASVPKGQGAE